MKTIYTVFNSSTQEILMAFTTAAAARCFLLDKLEDEKNNEISLILLDHELSRQDREANIKKITNIYTQAANRLEASYDFYYCNPVITGFGVDEYEVNETYLED